MRIGSGAAGGRARPTGNIARSSEGKIRSVRSRVVLVAPNFRENHTTEGGEGDDNAIFLVIVFIVCLHRNICG